eukprot:jgi/Mesen1/2204/ME000152S01290
MQHFPQEFLEAPRPLVALVGVPELHTKVAEYLQSLQPPVLSLSIHDPAKVTALGGRERRPPDAKLPPPVGIIKADWLTKHKERSASVVVVFLERERVYGDPAQWMGVCAEVDNIKNVVRGRNTKLLVVVVHSTNAGEPNEERFATLRKRAEVDPRCCLLFAAATADAPELRRSLARLGGAALEAAAAFYREEGRRVKARVERRAYSHSELSVRYYFKMAVFCEFGRDWPGALHNYQAAYATLRELAALYMVRHRKAFEAALARLEAFDTTGGDDPLAGRPDKVAPTLYLGQPPRLITRGPSVHDQRPTEAEYIRHELLASRHVSPSHAVIELLAKAHEQFKSMRAGGGGGGAARTVYQLGGEMGREYFHAREYDNARRLFHSVASCYRQGVLLHPSSLSYLRECARQLANLTEYIEYSLELAALPSGATAEGEGSGLVLGPEVGPAGPLGRCQQGTVLAELMGLLQGTTAVLPPRDEEPGLAISEAHPLDLEIDARSPLRPVLVATAVFLERTGKPHERQTLLLGLRSHLPDALSLWDLQVELSDPACCCTVAPAGLPGGAAAAGLRLGGAAEKEGQSGSSNADANTDASGSADADARQAAAGLGAEAQPPVVLLPGVWNRFELQVLPTKSGPLELTSVVARLGPHATVRSEVEAPSAVDLGSLWGAEPALAEPPFLDPALCLAGQRVLEVEEEDALADVSVECAPVGLAGEVLPVRVVVKSRGHAISAGELAIQLAPLGPPATASVTPGLVPPGGSPAVPGGSAMDGDGEAATQPCSAEVLLSRPLAGALGSEWSGAPGVAAAGRLVGGKADGGESSSGPAEGREDGGGSRAESEGNEKEGGGEGGGGGRGGGEGGDRGHEALHVESTRSIDVDRDNFVPLTGVLEVPSVAANGSWETLVHLRFREAAGVSLRASLTYAQGGRGGGEGQETGTRQQDGLTGGARSQRRFQMEKTIHVQCEEPLVTSHRYVGPYRRDALLPGGAVASRGGQVSAAAGVTLPVKDTSTLVVVTRSTASVPVKLLSVVFEEADRAACHVAPCQPATEVEAGEEAPSGGHAGGKDDGGGGNSGDVNGDYGDSSDRRPVIPRNRRWETVGDSDGTETTSIDGAGTRKGAGGEAGGLFLAKEEAFTRLFSVTPVKVSTGLSIGRLYIKWQRQEALGGSPTGRHVALPSGATATSAGEATGAASGPVAAELAVSDGGQVADSASSTSTSDRPPSALPVPAPVMLVIDLPPVRMEAPPLVVHVTCPQHGVLGAPLSLSLDVHNATAVLQEVVFSVVDVPSFVFSGVHSGTVSILPHSVHSLVYRLVPVASGMLQLPQVRLHATRYNARLYPSPHSNRLFVFPSPPSCRPQRLLVRAQAARASVKEGVFAG